MPCHRNPKRNPNEDFLKEETSDEIPVIEEIPSEELIACWISPEEIKEMHEKVFSCRNKTADFLKAEHSTEEIVSFLEETYDEVDLLLSWIDDQLDSRGD
jgi:hypothetical protein